MGRAFDAAQGDRESKVQPGLWLTRRRIAIVEALANGRTVKQIAHCLDISQPTIHEHIRAIRGLLSARNHAEVVARAAYHGLIEPGDLG